MPTEQLRVDIRLRDFMTRQLKKMQGTIGRFAAITIAKFRAIGRAIFSLRTGLIALAGVAVLGKLSKAFIRTAADVENMRLTLQSLLGDVGEANKLFEDLAKFAGQVPFQLEEIMKVGTMFAGTFKGGREEITKMLPLVADLAAYGRAFGITFEQTGLQISKMFSAGAGAADLFRDAGVLAMMGFQHGATMSVEETKKRVIAAWQDTGSKFRGLSQKMAGTWDGAVSMMGDSWFKFKKRVMEAGVFEFAKEGLRVLANELKAMTGRPEEFAAGVIDAFEGIGTVIGWVASGVKVLGIAFVGLGVVGQMFWLGLQTIFSSLVDSFANLLSIMQRVIINLRNAPGPVVSALELVLGPLDKIQGSLQDAEVAVRGFAVTVDKGAAESVEKLKSMLKTIKDLRTGIPHEEVAAFFKKIREGLAVRKDLEGLTAQYIKLREANKKAFATEDVRAMLDNMRAISLVTKAFLKHGERGAAALALAKKQAEGVKVAMGGAAETTGKAADKAKDMKDALETAVDPSRLDEFNEKMRAWQSTFDKVKSSAMAVGGILVDNIMRSIDQAVEGTFRWRKALQETAKDLGKMLLRQALMAAVQYGAGALAGAAAGPRPTAGGGGIPAGAREPFSFGMARGGVLGGFPSAQRGMLFNGDQLVRVGDNASKKEAGIFPLARGRHGKLGVEAVGAQPAPMQVIFNVNTIDERGVEGWLFENRHKMADMTGLSNSEGRTGRSSF